MVGAASCGTNGACVNSPQGVAGLLRIELVRLRRGSRWWCRRDARGSCGWDASELRLSCARDESELAERWDGLVRCLAPACSLEGEGGRDDDDDASVVERRGEEGARGAEGA